MNLLSGWGGGERKNGAYSSRIGGRGKNHWDGVGKVRSYLTKSRKTVQLGGGAFAIKGDEKPSLYVGREGWANTGTKNGSWRIERSGCLKDLSRGG